MTGALAPVVFSGENKLQTCKIMEIKAKENPIPPNSTLLSPMVLLVLTENGCIIQFEASQFGSPKHGIMVSGRSSLHVRVQT